MAHQPNGTPGSVELQVIVKLADPDATDPRVPVMVYAFARSGQLSDKAAPDTSGRARLRLPDVRVTQEVRVMVGPDAHGEQCTMSQLLRRGAKEQFLRISPAVDPPCLSFEIQPEVCEGWLRHCLVRGVLRKRAGESDAHADVPVCGARVQVWEVEPIELMIAKLPDPVIDDFRDLMLNAAREAQAHAAGLRWTDSAPSQRGSLRAAQLQSARPLVAAHMRELRATSHFAQLESVALHESAAQLRHHLARTGGVVRLLLCLLYPAWIRKQLLANAATGDSGRFETVVFPSSHCQSVNLSFTASIGLYGLSVPVCDPKPVACFTYWDYQSGTDVLLWADDMTPHPANDPSLTHQTSLACDAPRASERLFTAVGSA